MSRNKKLLITMSVMTCAIVLLIILLLNPVKENNSQDKVPAVNTQLPVEQKPEKVSVNIRAVGDNLMHSPIYNSCRTDDGFDFDGLYTNITPHIKDADIAAINQETIFVESVTALSGYPSFGTPSQVGDSIADAGFNLVTHATNHTYDKGYDSLMHTMDFWSGHKDITVLGINKSQQEQDTLKIWEKDGLKIALLNFTYGLNGYRLPSDKPYLVNLLDKGEKNTQLLKKAEESADITVVFLHFGVEYTHTPTKGQMEDIEFLCQGGADVIIGSHPHVIQPVAEHTSENGNKAVVFYSLGNFISNQDGTSKILGGMADVTITKDKDKTYVESYKMHPTVTHVSGGKYSAYMLSDYTDDLAKAHTRCRGLTVEKLQNLYNDVMAIRVY
ncbi:MAG: CapA family protein [Clostridia bacterium]|nr:CapA family protein [Clostridia bacterium]